jgi:hypothetical protein
MSLGRGDTMHRLSSLERDDLNMMIETHTFYGIPLEDVSPDILHEIDNDETVVLYIVACMLGWEVRDRDSFEHYPHEAEQYLKKFLLKH